MISDTERKLIDQVQYEEDRYKCVDYASKSDNPFFLLEYAQSYNWNDSFDIPNAISDNTSCDLGTALSLFWLAEGMCYLKGEIQRNDYNQDWADFCGKLIDRLQNGFYSIGPVSYAPPVTRTEAFKLNRLNVPPIFYSEVVGGQNR